MNKISIYALTFFLSLSSVTVYSQKNNKQVIFTNEQGSDIFYHTIERGQTVYAIATMYGVSVEDIYRLNPESKEGIKAGSTLRIPQKDSAIAPSGKADNYTYHTIQPKETLYSLSIKYSVPATDIIAANPGLSTSTFTIGKNIRIPPTRLETLPTTEKKTVQKEMEYTIQKKETMYRICRKFDISSVELLRLNPELKNGVKAGMVIKIPVASEEVITQNIRQPEEREVNALLSTPKDIKKVNRIQVALLLPFMTNETTQSSATSRFVEYYEGLLLAVDSLRNMGTSIELSVYDTGNGTKKVKEILKEDALSNANLIIGAVQNDQIVLIADFAQKHNIKYVIPFTSKNDDVLSNANVYQVNTPHSYLYSKAAQAGCDLFSDYNIILVNIKDKEEKPEFIKAFKTEMQQRDIPFKEVTYKGDTFATDIEAAMVRDKRNVVLPTSASLDAVNKIKAPLRMLSELKEEEKEPYMVNLFGYPEWQTYTRECLEDFYALNTYIYSNFYADNLSPEVHSFYSDYKNWYSKNLINTFPKYGILGFDTGMYFLGAINKYGSNFENNLDKIHYKSIQTGFDFHRVNNWGGFINTNLFIVHYKNDYTVTRSEVR
ncbi:LysM peptidoglycan-binding domain-containing protein [Parabacteroides distasonis]|jgi:lysM domain protein|uniref:LysM peptidoglycan-binding domain-containing protein n=1 Tax=Parabacteroides distasonis TaxID=823 RepID=UPI002805EB34|nr:LysM peptidoglycan-binding domain-containing protein [Parabacteroides distasonis]WMI43671.1 LysM peptidoglycan-binding domain-containing protein [Parabacteroides distasonis]